jgi:23S rRNA (guanosine2251-2'-O)-methyltransferase
MKPRYERERRPPRREKPPERETGTAAASVVYGVLPVLELLRANTRTIDKIAIADGVHEKRLSEIFDLARAMGIVVNRIPRNRLNELAGEGANNQGVVAFAAAASYSTLEDILGNCGKDALLLILDGLEDPRNFGAILRTAECAGVNGVVIPERRSVGMTETVSKSSAGATEYVAVAKAPNLNRLIEDLKARDIWVVGTSADAETTYVDWDWSRPTALVLGGEGKGLHRLVAENCDVLVKIPIYGKIQSLNVSVAAGVILFEAQRQRLNSGSNS